MDQIQNKSKIEQSATEQLAQFGYKDSAYVDVVKLGEKLGFLIGNADLEDCDDGFIIVNPNDDIPSLSSRKIIGVNSKRSIEEKRFIIAHELGHYLLHYDANSNAIYAKRENKTGKNGTENDADYFAACLLMPEQTFRYEYARSSSSRNDDCEIIKGLSELFVVPFESVRRRIDELALAV